MLDPYMGVSFSHDPLKKDSEEDPSAVEVRFIKRVIQRMVKTGRVQNPVKQSKTVNNKQAQGTRETKRGVTTTAIHTGHGTNRALNTGTN